MLRIAKLLTVFLLLFPQSGLLAAGKAAHVVVLVWDGMRPDFVTEKTTPTLMKLAREGVTFAHHHPVYVSSTEVNGTAFATGMYPEQSGIVGNEEYRPAISLTKPIMTANPPEVRRGDEILDSQFLRCPTLAETLHAHTLRTVVAGAKTVTLLLDRHAGENGGLGVDLFEGNVLPKAMAGELNGALGKFPPVGLPKRERDLWTTQALVGPLWDDGVPALSWLWLSEPDYSQHHTGPGSKTSLAAILSCDQNLAQVLAALDKKGVREQTDVIVVSDHGFSTIFQTAPVAALLRKAGFKAARAFSAAGPHPGEVMVVGNGGTTFLYVTGHDATQINQLAHWLQAQPFCGVVFTRIPVDGAFRLEQAKIDSPAAPDIVCAMRWKADSSANGTPGLIYSDASEYGPGQGMHASLSPFDMHNTCIAAGPDFRRDFQDPLPTGNIDIAPTVTWLLGVTPQRQPSGRVLHEALTENTERNAHPTSHHLETTYRDENFGWRQYLDYSEVSGVLYFDAGNGEQIQAATASASGAPGKSR